MGLTVSSKIEKQSHVNAKSRANCTSYYQRLSIYTLLIESTEQNINANAILPKRISDITIKYPILLQHL